MPAADSPVLPRGLIFLSSLWLVGSWLAAIGVNPPVQPSSASYTPGVRILLDCIGVGVIFAWPLLRLSQPRCSWSIQRAAVDVLVIAALLQLVVWPMRLVTPWSILRTVAIDGVLVGWTALIGAVLAVGGGLRAPGRTMAMVACVALAFVGPVAGVVAGTAGLEPRAVSALASLGPFATLRSLTGAGPAALDAEDLVGAGMGLVSAIAAWTAIGVAAIAANRSDAAHLGGSQRAASGVGSPPPLSSPPHA